jgi:hypothetical protein
VIPLLNGGDMMTQYVYFIAVHPHSMRIIASIGADKRLQSNHDTGGALQTMQAPSFI